MAHAEGFSSVITRPGLSGGPKQASMQESAHHTSHSCPDFDAKLLSHPFAAATPATDVWRPASNDLIETQARRSRVTRAVNGHSHRMYCSCLPLRPFPRSRTTVIAAFKLLRKVYICGWGDKPLSPSSRSDKPFVSHSPIDSATASDRRAPATESEREDSSFVTVFNVG